MTAPLLPWIPPAIRTLLLGDAGFTAACGGRCSTRAPSNVTAPYATIQTPGGFARDASAGAWTPLIQVDGWCPPGGTTDPEAAVWRIAAAAAAVLARARNVEYQNIHYSARVTDGPLTDEDVTRGAANPLYRALIRAELIIHAR